MEKCLLSLRIVGGSIDKRFSLIRLGKTDAGLPFDRLEILDAMHARYFKKHVVFRQQSVSMTVAFPAKGRYLKGIEASKRWVFNKGSRS